MKNLFIIWDEPLNLSAGGIHRCIATLMRYLPDRGINVHYLYSRDYYNTFHLDEPGKPGRILSIDELREHLIACKCGVILGQEAVFSSTLTQAVKKLNLPDVKFINQYHSSLLYFSKTLTFGYLKQEWRFNRDLSTRASIAIRCLLYPIWKFKVKRTQNNIYRFNYINSTVSLLLSEYEKPIFAKIIGKKDPSKCHVIPNPLSWEDVATPDILKHKKKEVLIVSRIYNSEKRIDLALKIWKILQLQGKTDGWTLRIVGDGIHKNYLMEMAKSMNLQNVIWEKRQDPRPFYKSASLFLLTSIVEGWALTLTESMQTGVVPLAFDSYPAVRSIITDGKDGYIVPSKDVKSMASKLSLLMENKSLRERMALNGIDSCRRFEINAVIDQWEKMLNNL